MKNKTFLAFVFLLSFLVISVSAADYKFQNTSGVDVVVISGASGNVVVISRASGNVTSDSSYEKIYKERNHYFIDMFPIDPLGSLDESFSGGLYG